MLVGCLAGCSTAAASQGGTSQLGTASPPMTEASEQTIVAVAEGNGSPTEISYEELFKPYAQFGLTYDASKNELTYNGKAVRWFEDYYTTADGSQAGRDFFNENGVVDVYAVRDFSSIIRADDGSFDPSGKLTGVKEFSTAEFAARDVEAIKNPGPITAISGDSLSAKELEDMAKEYQAFGVTYNVKENQWYFNGEKVRFFRDVLTSNGEGLTSGKFKGSMRVLGSADGTVDIYTVRDFAHPDTSGNGTLTGIEKYSQAEFDEHPPYSVSAVRFYLPGHWQRPFQISVLPAAWEGRHPYSCHPPV